MKAIQRFKSLISQSRVTTPHISHVPRLLAKGLLSKGATAEQPRSSSSSQQAPQTAEPTEPARQKSVAEQAAELVEQRKAFLQSDSSFGGTGSEQEARVGTQTSNSTEKQTLLLGIGTGGRDEFSTTEPSAHTVSESPTGIDFDVYDRAFATEIKRIRSDHKRNPTKTYLTKLVGDIEMDKYVGDDHMIIEAGKSLVTNALASSSSVVSKGLSRVYEAGGASLREGEWIEHIDVKRKEGQEGVKRMVEAAGETGSKFADLVTSVTKDMKEKATS
jgi:[calcium/calmodulin-dependent protein kinase] kinase